jgi:surface polysaccharide O-acyltransferase-like enzyme
MLLLISSSTFGIYLVHPFFLLVCYKFEISGIFSVLFTFVISMLIIILLKVSFKKIKFLRLIC